MLEKPITVLRRAPVRGHILDFSFSYYDNKGVIDWNAAAVTLVCNPELLLGYIQIIEDSDTMLTDVDAFLNCILEDNICYKLLGIVDNINCANTVLEAITRDDVVNRINKGVFDYLRGNND